MKTITASQARSQLFNLLKITVKGHRQIRITSKEGSAVVMSEEDYDSLLETLELLSIKGFKDSIDTADAEIERGDLFTIEEAFE